MSSPQAFWDGFQYLLIGTVTSIILVFFVGVAIDGTISQMEQISIFDVPGIWGSASSFDAYFWQKFAYVIAISPCILGVIAQVVAAVQKEKVETEGAGIMQFSEEMDI